jgi:hypothetical protein
MPPTCTVVVLRKPVPFTVSVSCAEPATTVVGLIEVTVGAVSCVPPPPPDEDPPPPPQLERREDARRQEDAR